MYQLPKLNFSYSDLEPYIDSQTMQIHYEKHHQAYVDNLNKALESRSDLQDLPIEELLARLPSLQDPLKQTLINNGGGHSNHSLFWQMLSPSKTRPSDKLLLALETTFGSYQSFIGQFTDKAMSVFGSGWTFLIINKTGGLQLKRHSFQNSPLMTGNIPLIALDLWEHAYYLKYQNRKKEYVEAFWSVLNWEFVSAKFDEASVK